MLRRTLLASAGAMALTGAALAAEPARAPPPSAPAAYLQLDRLLCRINAGGHWSSGSTTQFTGTDTDVAFGGGLGAALAAGEIPSTGASGAPALSAAVGSATTIRSTASWWASKSISMALPGAAVRTPCFQSPLLRLSSSLRHQRKAISSSIGSGRCAAKSAGRRSIAF